MSQIETQPPPPSRYGRLRDGFDTYETLRQQWGEWGLLPTEAANGAYGSMLPSRKERIFGALDYINCTHPDWDRPTWNVFVPVAFNPENSEELQDIAKTVKIIHGLCEYDGSDAGVTLWFNTRLPNDDELLDPSSGGFMDLSCLVYDRYREYIQRLRYELALPIDSNTVRVRARHQFLDPSYGMNELRAYGYAALGLEVSVTGGDQRRFIIGVDADTPFADKRLFTEMREAHETHAAFFVRANLAYVGDDESAPPFAERSQAEKTAALYAITRRMLERNHIPSDDQRFVDGKEYIDESWTSFESETYWPTGGVGINHPDRGQMRTLAVERTPAAQARGDLDPQKPLIHTVAAKGGTSYRRFVKLMEEGMRPIDLPKLEDGPDYVSYQFMASKQSQQENTPTTEAELWKMIDFMDDRQVERTSRPESILTDRQRRHLGLIIARFGLANTVEIET